ncbi:hypothetical protein BDQ12DRAFT_683662 [Crucibulum laeve]|uniref:EamA domain-containing protein n=1 Tax=Crucibulum laeve TaxID=68775 RepID=A0A5C3M0Z3_9AGAR|nr:hypothetical protein BDQ12DRAFT_683662 [Crucibulum laeve]
MSSRTAYTASVPNCDDFKFHGPSSTQIETIQARSPFPSEEYEVLKLRHGVIDSLKDWYNDNTGLLLVVGSQACFSLMDLAVQELDGMDPPVTTFQLIFFRMSITYICSMVYMLATGIPDPWLGPKGTRLLLATRAFCAFFGLFGLYYSLRYLSLSDATVLTFIAPMCTAVSGAVFLKERFVPKHALAGLFSLCGVILIARPNFIFGEASQVPGADIPGGAERGTPAQRLGAVGVALIGVLGATGAYTSIRAATGKPTHALHSMTYLSAFCVVISSIWMLATETPFIVVPTDIEWLVMLLMVAFFGFFGQILLTMGLQRETATRGTMAVYTQVLFANILEQIFFHTVPSVLSIVGTLMIMAAALYVALTKPKALILEKQPDENHLEEGLLESENQDLRS